MRFAIQTAGNYDLVNLTERVGEIIAESGVKSGVAVIFAQHTTVGLTLMEWEAGTQKDLVAALERIAPQKGDYFHAKWNDGNGAAHVKSALSPPSISIPIEKNRLALGTWQNLVLIDFDVRPREREVVVKIIPDVR
ncbi:secondary thiamine-phosphate synthase enzyme YjbQ [Candidatus Gracilibacteria bacterium]|nr:secondary thiamine-phosphate synthase enzyme YjbQ [Candidatus Gracilibacteria bacterium]MCF7856209.1 secondary thiamine-phosphate synthase enzyme YjbQ [Candidatus Gracilibacteria bacterium]MCF7896481.1 secondary thiamine-phosphate synthase enzyme YjbQ [Candidatus Gracilibacteria bacterium]